MISSIPLPTTAQLLTDISRSIVASLDFHLAAPQSVDSPEAEYFTCSKCKQIKHVTDFYKDSRKGRTHSSRCKVCSKAASAAAKKARKLFPEKQFKLHLGTGDK